MDSLSDVISAVTTTTASMAYVIDVIETALSIPLVQFFVALGICGIAYRFAKGLLNLR